MMMGSKEYLSNCFFCFLLIIFILNLVFFLFSIFLKYFLYILNFLVVIRVEGFIFCNFLLEYLMIVLFSGLVRRILFVLLILKMLLGLCLNKD